MPGLLDIIGEWAPPNSTGATPYFSLRTPKVEDWLITSAAPRLLAANDRKHDKSNDLHGVTLQERYEVAACRCRHVLYCLSPQFPAARFHVPGVGPSANSASSYTRHSHLCCPPVRIEFPHPFRTLHLGSL